VLATARSTCSANTIPTVRTLGSSNAAVLASYSPARCELGQRVFHAQLAS
jgi:hypothetical protein